MGQIMFSHLYKLLLSIIIIISTNVTYAADEDLDFLRETNQLSNEWRLIRHDKIRNIKAYDKREAEQRIRSFKVEYDIDASLDDIARVYFDFDNYHRWFYELISAKLITKISPTEFYYYSSHRAPNGLPDRDTVMHGIIEPYNKKRGFARLILTSQPHYLPEKPPLVRIPKMNITVTWTPSEKGGVHGVTEGMVDPGGFSPAWAINYVQRQAPYLTTLAFTRMLKHPMYSNSKTMPAFSLSE
jgi:hypothetical protein